MTRPARETANAVIEIVEVVGNDRVAAGVGLVALHAPRVAATALPGQFVHLRIARGADFILRRPFSVHRVEGERIELLYQVVGKGTLALAEKRRGELMDVIGPLGTGFVVPEGTAHALVVAGGLGAAPLGMLVEDLAARGVATSVAQGAPTSERLVASGTFERLARRVAFATDDGSRGHAGRVTDLVPALLEEDSPSVVYACGPSAMSAKVAALAAEAGVTCQVSLERLMACGVGACLSCVVTTKNGSACACCDGPVFDASEVVWDEA
ncbi:MAG: dihydroorotate dehydrogenase electron transfer subunit [Coriobacteriia bacterium]